MKRKIILVLCVVAVLLFGAISVAGAYYASSKKQSGAVMSQIVNRVNFTFENTEQVFQASDGSYVAEILFTAEKTEADFYAELLDITLDGMSYDRMEILPAADSEWNAALNGAVLPAKNGETMPLQWKIRIYFTAASADALQPVLHVDYISGVNAQSAVRRVFDAALSFVIENK